MLNYFQNVERSVATNDQPELRQLASKKLHFLYFKIFLHPRTQSVSSMFYCAFHGSGFGFNSYSFGGVAPIKFFTK